MLMKLTPICSMNNFYKKDVFVVKYLGIDEAENDTSSDTVFAQFFQGHCHTWALVTRDIFAHNIAIKRYCNNLSI